MYSEISIATTTHSTIVLKMIDIGLLMLPSSSLSNKPFIHFQPESIAIHMVASNRMMFILCLL